MEYVHIVKGKYSQGRDSFREINHVTFPLIDGTLQQNDKGMFIRVDGGPVRGYPKRAFSVFVENEQSFVVGDEAKCNQVGTIAQAVEGDMVKAPTVATDEQTHQAIIASLNGDDDDVVKRRIKDRFHVMKQLAWAAGDGDIKALVISGPPGVGKSHELVQALEHENDSSAVMAALVDPSVRGDSDLPEPEVPTPKPKVRYEVVSGRVTAGGLYELLYRFSDERSVVVLDDCDVFSDETSLDLLKKALDHSNKRVLSWRTRAFSRGDTPEQFTFKGSVIFITNLDFENPKVKGSSLAPHIEAIMSRVFYLDLTMHSLREKYLRIEQVCVDDQLLEKLGLEHDAIKDVMEFFKQHIMHFREVSIRTVQKIGTMRKMDASDWQRLAAITTMKTSSLSQLSFS